VSGPFEQRAHQPTNVVVVVDDENLGTRHRVSFHRRVRTPPLWPIYSGDDRIDAEFVTGLRRPRADATTKTRRRSTRSSSR
jgi:hypothetical protein